MTDSKRILVAPLNWGLGHATRCIPVIEALMQQGYEPVIASDGAALALLRKEFPELEWAELPSYRITYASNGKFFKWKMLWDSPRILYAVQAEFFRTREILRKYRIDGIISDNRLGVWSSGVPSVFITHQLNVLTGNTTRLSSWIHQRIISLYRECWVPDLPGEVNLSGVLGHMKRPLHNLRYIGPLSRFEPRELPEVYDLLVLLSGPEPQRSMLESRLLKELETYTGKVLFVCGRIEAEQIAEKRGHITYYNYMSSRQLNKALNASKLVLSRSGYTTVLDLAKLSKKAFFIPTPGQYEQEYLAKRLDEMGLVPSCGQDAFTLSMLERCERYKGLGFSDGRAFDLQGIFGLFEGEGELRAYA